MNSHALLTSQGWRGTGHSLHSSSDTIGLSRPLLVAQKQNNLGVGKKQHKTSDMWWMNAFDKSLQGLDTSVQGVVVQRETTGGLDMVKKGGGRFVGSKGLYGCFVRGEVLGGTLDELKSSEKSTKDTTRESSAERPTKKRKAEESKEDRRERKTMKRVKRVDLISSSVVEGIEKERSPEPEEDNAKVETKEQRKERRRLKKLLKEAVQTADSEKATSKQSEEQSAELDIESTKVETKEERRERRRQKKLEKEAEQGDLEVSPEKTKKKKRQKE